MLWPGKAVSGFCENSRQHCVDCWHSSPTKENKKKNALIPCRKEFASIKEEEGIAGFHCRNAFRNADWCKNGFPTVPSAPQAVQCKESTGYCKRWEFNPWVWVRKIRWGYGNAFQYSCLGNPMTEEPSGIQSMGSHATEWVSIHTPSIIKENTQIFVSLPSTIQSLHLLLPILWDLPET